MHNISKVYRTDLIETHALRDFSLEVNEGEFVAVTGPSGSGKTTFLNIAGLLESFDTGAYKLDGADVSRLSDDERSRIRNQKIGFIFQSFNLIPDLDVFDNVDVPLRYRGMSATERKKRITDALEVVGLASRMKHIPAQLSGGQQQRVALARALVNRPQVLLLDEPLGALDLKLRKQMQLELKAIQNDLGLTFVHVTHDQEEAMTMADAIAVMNRGRIEQLGPPSELYERPATAFVAGFLGVSNLLLGTVTAPNRVRLDTGDELAADPGDRTGRVAVGIRPEKLRLGPASNGDNSLSGTVKETAYVGVATQYVVETGAGTLIVYVQNDGAAPSLQPGGAVTLSWSPHATFVVDPAQEDENDPSADTP
jgi:ABC-type Fe3+/spermidine/putrescine transport system ATPase subunit